MSNSNSFGGKLKKVLASMCSFVVGASGVSQAGKLATNVPINLKVDKNARSLYFWDFGWRLESNVGNAKKVNSWLVETEKDEEGKNPERSLPFGKLDEINFYVGFSYDDDLCSFCIWDDNSNPKVCFDIPKGMLFDAMRYFELNYYPSGNEARNNGTTLSCAAEPLNEDPGDEIFLRFILWAFCSADGAIDPNSGSDIQDLKDTIFDLAVKEDNPDGNKFVLVNAKEVNKRYGILRSGYFVENFCTRIRDIYQDLKYSTTQVNEMTSTISQLNIEKENLNNRIGQLNDQIKQFGQNKENSNKQIADLSAQKETLEKQVDDLNTKMSTLKNEKEDLEKKKHPGKYIVSILATLFTEHVLIKKAHRFLGAKRSRSSEVNKGKPSINEVNKGKPSINKVNKGKPSINKVNKGKPSINKVNKGKPSSNKKGEQRAKRNLKKRRG